MNSRESKSEAERRALQEQLPQVRAEPTERTLADELDENSLHFSRLPVLDTRSAEEILGYDEHGLPT